MEFRLTYAGRLLAHKDNIKLRERSLHVHEIRKSFHKQLKVLWQEHPVFSQIRRDGSSVSSASLTWGSGAPPLNQIYDREGFKWLPIVTDDNGLICKVDVLMLRTGQPGKVLFDVDNRLKTLFDALRMPKTPGELGAETGKGKIAPDPDEEPFYVVLEEDKLITHIAVTSDALLEPVENVRPEEAVRLVVDVTIKPYKAFAETAGFA